MRRARATLAVLLAGFAIAGIAPALASAASTAGFPDGFEGYHTYDEMTAELDTIAAAYPGIARKLAIGQSYEGRTIWALKISDRVGRDESEPEVLLESLHHAREHLTVEMNLHVARLLTENYGRQTALGQRVTNIVKSREIWIVPMINPDGGEWDISSGDGFQNWRRNRQPIDETSPLGIDLNRNWGFKWGCCGGSSGTPGTTTYRGPAPWYAPEVRVLRDFVLNRIRNGRQQIRAAISWHTFNEEIMWPYGYTYADLPRTMTADDLGAFRALGRAMADRNGYVAQQMSDLYKLDGGASDWLYGIQRIFAFTIEMYPTDGSGVGGFYPPDDVIEAQTARNDDVVLYFLEQADCPYRAAGMGVTHCGPLNDDFETGRGWKVNPFGTDTATRGRLERGVPAQTSDSSGVKQLAYGYSGQSALVTGAVAGSSAGAKDLDGGTTSVRSPVVKLGSAGSTGWTLAFRYSFAHDATATAADYLRVTINGSEVFRISANGASRNGAWAAESIDLDAFAGQKVKVLIEASDGGADSLVEAAIDDVRVYRQQ